jgi:hypothetical protein
MVVGHTLMHSMDQAELSFMRAYKYKEVSESVCRENAWDGWEKKAIMVANHVSYIDPLFAVAVFAPSGVAKVSRPCLRSSGHSFGRMSLDLVLLLESASSQG